MTLEEQVRELRELRAEKDRTAKVAAEAKLAYDNAHLALWERMDGSGVDSVKVDGVGYSKAAPKPFGAVADKAELYRWAVEEGNMPELFDPEPRMQLINEQVRLRLDNGEEMLPGVNFYTKQVVYQRKS